MLALIVAGCTSAPAVPTGSPSRAPTVSPSPSSTRSPSPSVDVAQAFVRKMTVPRFAARGTFSGRMTVGTNSATFSGEFTTDGPDYRRSIALRSGGRTLETREELEAGGKQYVKQDQGPWILEPAATGARDPRRKGESSMLAAIRSVRDVGVELYAGRELHRLRPSPHVRLDPGALGLAGPSARNGTASVEFLAKPDGDLAVMLVTGSWRESYRDGHLHRVNMTVAYTYTDVTGPFSVSPPPDAWQRFTSKRFGYSIAYPEGWEVESDKDTDYFLSPGVEEVQVWHQRVDRRTTLRNWSAESVAFNLRDIKARPEKNEPFILDGEPARLLTYHATIGGEKTYFLDVVAVHASRGYDVVWYSAPGNEKADRALFMRFLSTFTYTR